MVDAVAVSSGEVGASLHAAAVFTLVVVTQSVPDGCTSPIASITVVGTKAPPTAVSVTLIVPYVDVSERVEHRTANRHDAVEPLGDRRSGGCCCGARSVGEVGVSSLHPAASTRSLLPSGCERSSWSCSAHDCGGTQPGYFGGAGRAKRALSMGTLGCTDSISKIDLPFNQLTVHLNGIFTPATSR